MPLTECRRVVAVLAQDLSVVLGIIGASPLVAREACGNLHHRTDIDNVMVTSG